jgi:hypothetical protein
MPVFRLSPVDPFDHVWADSPFVGPVWIDASNETAARAKVSLMAREGIPNPPRRWPWFFAAHCARDDSHGPLQEGKLLEAGRRKRPRS